MQDAAPSLDDQQAYYDSRWATESQAINRLELLRLRRILEQIARSGINPATAGLRICDLGCGRGWLSNALSCLGHVTGVDLSSAAVAAASERWPSIDFQQGDVTRWRSEQPFDLVVSSEVVEHVPDKSAFFETAKAILKPGGLLVLTTPNRRMLDQYLRSGAEIQPVEEWLSAGDLQGHLADGFTVEQFTTFTIDHSYAGIFRIASAPRLRRAAEALHVERWRQSLHERLGWGLHFLVTARRG